MSHSNHFQEITTYGRILSYAVLIGEISRGKNNAQHGLLLPSLLVILLIKYAVKIIYIFISTGQEKKNAISVRSGFYSLLSLCEIMAAGIIKTTFYLLMIIIFASAIFYFRNLIEINVTHVTLAYIL